MAGNASESLLPIKLPSGYGAFLEDLKARIHAAQVRAVLSVNRELTALYWHIGKSIVERQRTEGWGRSVVERLASDLQAAFPGMSGFSPQNIWRMRAFYLAWTEEIQNLSQPVRETDGVNPPQPVEKLPWGHNAILLTKIVGINQDVRVNEYLFCHAIPLWKQFYCRPCETLS